MNKQDIKYKIKLLKQMKKNTALKTQARRDLNKQIRDLKNKLKEGIEPLTDEKQALIDKILNLRPEYKTMNFDLSVYTMEQLKKHYNKVRR